MQLEGGLGHENAKPWSTADLVQIAEAEHCPVAADDNSPTHAQARVVPRRLEASRCFFAVAFSQWRA